MAEINTFYPTQFETSWNQVLQQKDARLVPHTWRSDFVGKNKWFNLINTNTMLPVLQRKGDTRDGEFDGQKYWLTQRPYDWVMTFDEFDQHFLDGIVLPTSEEIQSAAMAANRRMDDTIITAFDATRYIGEDGTTASPFPAAQSIAANYVETGTPASAGLTIAKLRRAKYLMDSQEVEEEDRYIAVGSQQIQDLLRTTEVTNDLYNSVKALVDGKIEKFLGFHFVRIERLPIGTVSGTADIRSAFAWHKTGIRFASGERKVYMDPLPTRSHALQLRTTLMNGAVRTEDPKVVRIYCDETP